MPGSLRKLNFGLHVTNSPKKSESKVKKHKEWLRFESVGSFDELSTTEESNNNNKLTIDSASKVNCNEMTLLEKALYYRNENPDVWKAKQQAKDMNGRHSPILSDEDSTFLDSYYKTHDQAIEENRKLEEQRKLENPKVVLKLIYDLKTANTRKKSTISGSHLSSGKHMCVFTPEETDFDVYKTEATADKRDNESELVISVVEGRNLLNKLSLARDKYHTTIVKCKLCTNNSIHKQKHKSEDVYVNRKGKTRWNHNFVLKGFSTEVLKTSYVVLNVAGKYEETTEVIGEVTLSGSEAIIPICRTDSYRLPTAEELEGWHKAIDNPGAPVEITRDVLHPNKELFSATNVSTLRRKSSTSTISRKKFKERLTSPILKPTISLRRFMGSVL